MSSHEVNTTIPENERVERLRKILQKEQQRQVAYEEAFEVAQLLTNFYDNLADNSLGVGQVLQIEVEHG
jgi:16S rRNA C1402 (ribose-2'-O) methylase RsmI